MKPSKIFQTKAKIIKNVEVVSDYYKMVLNAPDIAKQAQPGQFVNIRVNDKYEPLLRRPFSIHSIKGANIDILYEVIGEGTQVLSQKKPGEYLDIIGSLGHGFSYREPRPENRKPILIAGGMGVAPLVFLAEKLVTREPRTENRKPIVLIGARTKSGLLCEKEFKKLGCSVKIATDDGSKGHRGFITDLLKSLLREPRTENREPILYACGPHAMLKVVAAISKKRCIPTQVSLEEHMACGIGACLGCVVRTKSGSERACKEGPVFNADEIIW